MARALAIMLTPTRTISGAYPIPCRAHIGYSDSAPRQPLARVFAIGIGLTGVLLVGLIVAVAVRALEGAARRSREERWLPRQKRALR